MNDDEKFQRVTVVTKGGEVFSWYARISDPHKWFYDRISYEFGMIPIVGDKGPIFQSVEGITRISFEEVDG